VSCQEGVRKPDSRIYDMVQERLGVPPSSLILVDDSASNVKAAEGNGWRGFVFEGAERLSADLEECGVEVDCA